MFKKILIWMGGLLLAFMLFMGAVSWWAVNTDTTQPLPVAPLTPAQIRSNQIQAALNKAYIPVQVQIQSMMHDPDSFELVNTTYTDRGEYLVMSITFRGRNRLGAKALNSMDARIGMDGNVWTVGKIE